MIFLFYIATKFCIKVHSYVNVRAVRVRSLSNAVITSCILLVLDIQF